MRFILLFVIFLFSLAELNSQSLNRPESVAFDSLGGYIWVSNPGVRNIVVVRNPGDTSVFASELRIPLGLRYHMDLLWCADSSRLLAFNINGSLIHELEIPGARQLNGLCPLPDGGLLVSDRQGNAILRVKVPSMQYDTLLANGISTPNGMTLLDSNNVLVVNSTDSASVFIISLSDGAILKEIPTGMANLDGITQLRGRYFLVSSWGKGWVDPAIFCISIDEQYSMQVIDKSTSCADIHYFPQLGFLFVPAYRENKLRAIPVEDLYKSCSTMKGFEWK